MVQKRKQEALARANGAPRRAGVGRVRRLAFLSILRGALPLSQTYWPMTFRHAQRVFPQPFR